MANERLAALLREAEVNSEGHFMLTESQKADLEKRVKCLVDSIEIIEQPDKDPKS